MNQMFKNSTLIDPDCYLFISECPIPVPKKTMSVIKINDDATYTYCVPPGLQIDRYLSHKYPGSTSVSIKSS